jgi:hypothetical protein
MSSADVRNQINEFRSGEVTLIEDPYWPELGFMFPVSPAEIQDWATLIFNASDFLTLFED